MSKTLTRDEAHTLITNVFYSFHGNDMVDPVRDKAEATRFKQGLSALSQLYGKKDYIEAVEALSMEGFTEYFNIVGDFWKLMNVESSALFEKAEIVSSATLGSELGKEDDAGKITSLISGFTPLEIVSLTYDDKMRAVNKILDDWFVFDDKEQALLTLISSMNEEERKNFFSALIDGENPLLSKLLSKVNGAEKVSLFMYINTLLLMSGIETDAKGVPPTVRNDFWAGKSFMAFYVDGKINIVQHEATLLGTRIAGNWSLSPFSTVSYTYGADKTFNVPAFFLTDQGALENVIGEQNFVDVIWGAVQGEFNENPTGKEILADIGINFIPIVGQICDARDIAACLEKLINQGRVTEVMVWVTLLLTAVGCIPYAGDVVKGALKAIVKGADDVALVLVKKVGGDNVVIALRLVSSKLDDAVPEIRKLIQGWAEDAAKKGSPNAAEFFAKMDEMINAAVREIKGKIDDFGRRVGGEAEESITIQRSIDNPDHIILEGKKKVLKSNHTYTTDIGYKYATDDIGRIENVEGTLTFGKAKRNSYAQRTVGGTDRLDTDQGGHLIASIFNGSGEIDNLVPMNSNLNQGAWKTMENSWVKALNEDKSVEVMIDVIYTGTSKRPSDFLVTWYINGERYTQPFKNLPGGGL